METERGEGMSTHVTKGELTDSVGRTFSYHQASIFDLPPAFRASDPITSKIAGRKQERSSRCAQMRRDILAILATRGMTSAELERLPQWTDAKPSTVRKRVSELLHQGKVRSIGIKEGGNIWAAVP